MADVAVVTLHGMGQQVHGYSDQLKAGVARHLGPKFDRVAWAEVYYKDILLGNEERYWNNARLGLGWVSMREFMLFGFADASGLEANKETKDSAYDGAQIKIAQALLEARGPLDSGRPIVIVAHSLGCQVISNYLWDGQHFAAGNTLDESIFCDLDYYGEKIRPGKKLSPEEKAFLAKPNIKAMVTTGCNIPLFVAAHSKVVPIAAPQPGFTWDNYYSKNDVLGWPLAGLGPEYRALITDHRISTTGTLGDWLLRSWNPLSHDAYWRTGEVQGRVAALLE